MITETPDIIPFTSPFKSELLTQAEIETLKGGTLRLLDEVGVHFPSLVIVTQSGFHSSVAAEGVTGLPFFLDSAKFCKSSKVIP